MPWKGWEFKHLDKVAPNSYWLQLTAGTKAEYGRAWINPDINMEKFRAFFHEKGYTPNFLTKENFT